MNFAAMDLREDPQKLQEMRDLLKPILGNSLAYHEGEDVEPQPGPLLDLSIKSWPVTVDGLLDIAYGISLCSLVVH